MNREILFRGMISMGDMMEGSLLINGDKTTIMNRSLVFGYGFDPKTVGQYTGLKDKNGVKIFEGDVLRVLVTDWPSMIEADNMSLEEYLIKIAKVGVVKSNGWSFYVEHKNGYELSMNWYPNGFIEVIGNIHQNPELL